MKAKIERVCKEIEKTKEKINEQQARLRDLEKQKTEFENLDIVSTVRGMNISFAELAELLKNVRPDFSGNSRNPGTLPTSGQVGPKSGAKPTADVSATDNEMTAHETTAPNTTNNKQEE